MLNPVIQSLLILQDRDLKRLGLEGQLKAVPGDIARGEQQNAAETEMKANISGHEARIKMLKERETSLAAELKKAQAEVAVARTPVEPLKLRIYDRIATRSMPVVVPIVGGKCGGCHLKVSSEV